MGRLSEFMFQVCVLSRHTTTTTTTIIGGACNTIQQQYDKDSITIYIVVFRMIREIERTICCVSIYGEQKVSFEEEHSREKNKRL